MGRRKPPPRLLLLQTFSLSSSRWKPGVNWERSEMRRFFFSAFPPFEKKTLGEGFCRCRTLQLPKGETCLGLMNVGGIWFVWFANVEWPTIVSAGCNFEIWAMRISNLGSSVGFRDTAPSQKCTTYLGRFGVDRSKCCFQNTYEVIGQTLLKTNFA